MKNETFSSTKWKETKQPTDNFANITNLAISNVYEPEPIIFKYDLLSWGGKGVNNQGIINIDKGGIIYRGVVEDSEDTDIKDLTASYNRIPYTPYDIVNTDCLVIEDLYPCLSLCEQPEPEPV